MPAASIGSIVAPTEPVSTSGSIAIAQSSSTLSHIASSANPTDTSISWGPAITASPLSRSSAIMMGPKSSLASSTVASEAQSSTAGSFSSTSSSTASASMAASGHGLTHKQKEITIATTVIGGVFIIAILLYLLYRRRRGATASEIFCCRRPRGSTPLPSPMLQDSSLTALPIYQETRFSMRSSKHDSQISTTMQASMPTTVPPHVAKRFHKQNPYIKDTWQTESRHSIVRSPANADSSFFLDAAPPKKRPSTAAGAGATAAAASRPRTPDLARQQRQRQQTTDTFKTMHVLTCETSPSLTKSNMGTGPDSPSSQRALDDRWSWTNPDAPPTPRFAPSLRSSISSLPAFRSIKSWVRGQNQRIEEELPPRPTTSATTKRLVLKNQASKPNLAPPKIGAPAPHKKKARPGSLSSMFRQSLGLRVSSAPVSPGLLEEQRETALPSIEMRQVPA